MSNQQSTNPLSSLAIDLGETKNNLVEILNNKGISSKTYESLDSLISKVDNIVIENLDDELASQDDLISQIQSAVVNKAGVSLPELSNPATAAQILSGYEAINGDGEVVTGKAAGTIGVKTGTVTLVDDRDVVTTIDCPNIIGVGIRTTMLSNYLASAFGRPSDPVYDSAGYKYTAGITASVGGIQTMMLVTDNQVTLRAYKYNSNYLSYNYYIFYEA